MPRVKEYEIEDISKMTVTQCRSAYKKLVNEYQKIKNGAYCHECGKFKGRDKFQKLHQVLFLFVKNVFIK